MIDDYLERNKIYIYQHSNFLSWEKLSIFEGYYLVKLEENLVFQGHVLEFICALKINKRIWKF